VRVFVREGAAVASLDVADEAGERIVAEANGEGPGRAVYHHCDVSRRDEVLRAFGQAAADLGGLDALIHVAGVEGKPSPVESMTEEEWDRVVDINLKGTFLTNQAAFPYLREHGGRIANFASAAGLVSFPNIGQYSASKGGVISWSRCLAQEWGRYGITVVSIIPHAQTPMVERSQASWSPEQVEKGKATTAATALGRRGDPETDIAPVLVFLVSDASRYITGQMVAIDGGLAPLR
jgi:NAD(P)-dependent dehydrogenase (short-subunit alcohol dehydrogenase family)